MFKKIGYLILLVTGISFSQGIKGKITYMASSNQEINKERLEIDTQISDQERKMQLHNISKSVPENFHLIFEGGESIFKAEYDMSTRRRLGLVMNYTGFLAQSQYMYYFNTGNENVFGQSFFMDDIVVAFEAIDWSVTQETKMIGNYKCYKATAVISKDQTHYSENYIQPVVAWFTPEIPVHFGIRHFYGLPGLTMELTINTGRGEVTFKATKIELNIDEELKIKELEGKLITEDDYIKMMHKLNSQRRKK